MSGWARMLWWVAAMMIVAGGALSALGEGREGGGGGAGSGSNLGAAIRQEHRSGDVVLVMTASRSELSVAERVTLTMEVESGAGVWVGWPGLERPVLGVGEARGVGETKGMDEKVGEKVDEKVDEKLGPWRVVSVRDESRVAKDRFVRRRVMVLEPFLAGSYETPAMAVRFGPSEGKVHGSMTTKAFTVKVTSLLGGGGTKGADFDLGQPREALTLEAGASWWSGRRWAIVAWAGAMAVASVGVIAWLLVKRARGKQKSELVEGIRVLEAVVAGQGDKMKAWDAIARSMRAGIAERIEPRALGMTAEEIAAHAEGGWPTFGVGEVRELRRVLETCDRARYEGEGVDREAEVATAALGLLRPLLMLPRAAAAKEGSA